MARAGWIKLSLILITAGFCCTVLTGATNTPTASGFETPPPERGSIPWDKIQTITKERQELYRKRVSIPGAITGDVPRVADASLAGAQTIAAPPATPAATVSSGSFLSWIFAAACVFGGILMLQKFAPHILASFNQRFNPWAPTPSAVRNVPGRVRAEEESFARFLTAFRMGPSAAPRRAALAKIDPIKEFYARASTRLAAPRKNLQDIALELRDPLRQKKLAGLRQELTALKDAADFPELLPVWQVASALEGLLKQLTEKMGDVTASTLRSVEGGLDLLDKLCRPRLKPENLTERPFKFLVVDDDLISRQALSLALKKTFSPPDLAEDSATALVQINQQAYDVIFLDVQMPGMDGFELCTKIRNSIHNRTTPVIFVTALQDFDARAKSVLSGGNDLMGKPFLTFEVTVKAFTLGLQDRLHGRSLKTVQRLEPGRDQPAAPETVGQVARPVTNSAIIMPPLEMEVTTEPIRFTNATLIRAAKKLRRLPAAPAPLPATPKSGEFDIAFLARASMHLGPLRELCQQMLQVTEAEARQALLADIFLRINSLAARTDDATVHPAYQISVALEGLLRKLLENPANSTASTPATIAAAMDLLYDLCGPGMRTDLANNPPIEILVVDDDLVSRRTLVGALQTAFKKPDSADNGEEALARVAGKQFDVIFLDVIMPGMDGFEVCSKIRATVANRATPVVFVTGHSDGDARTRMSRCGGNELLAKPFLTAEITMKSLTLALRVRLEQLKLPPVA